MAEIRLPFRLGVEADALYRTFGYTSHSQSCCAASTIRERSNSWEFPLIVKYRIPAPLVHPFVGIGADWRHVQGTDTSYGYYMSAPSQGTYFNNVRGPTNYSLTHGLVVSAGVDLGVRHIRFSPQFRYVHWTAPFLYQVGGDGSYYIQSPQNEYFVLVGLSWHR
jgi:hypothetical protein